MIKQLTTNDVEQFSDLIVNMYSNLENLEWFSPMPYDIDSVRSMIENPRFYIIGYFEDDVLCGVSSLDYKCGKLIGKVNFPSDCNTDKLVEIGFNIVRSNHRGNGIMKKLVSYLLQKIKQDGFEWVFAKVHKDNFASSKSLLKNDFFVFSEYQKPVNINEFKSLSSASFFCEKGKENALKTLSKYDDNNTEIIVDYNILIKKL